MAAIDQIIRFPIMDSSLNTISGLVNHPNFVAKGATIGEFVSMKDSSGVTNLERIYSRYRSKEFEDDTAFLEETKIDIGIMKSMSGDSAKAFKPKYDLLYTGTEVVINTSYIHRTLPVSKGGTVRYANIEPFMHEALRSLIDDDDYVDEKSFDDTTVGLFDRNPRATVWIWCKSLGDGDHVSGKLVDITPFLSGLNVYKEKISGKFTLTLSYTYSEFKEMCGSMYYDSIINSVDNVGKRRRNSSQFHALINSNDVVFIRLSRLKMENGIPENSGISMDVRPSDIPNKVYDMIGLVDKVADDFGGGGDYVSVTISGSDLTKLLSEDGSSVYQNRYVSSGRTSDEIELSSDIFRMWGKHTSLFQLQDQTIADQLQFVLDYMTRSVICSDLFEGHPRARKTKMSIGEGGSVVTSEVKGVWQIMEVGVDQNVSNYTAFNTRLGNDYSPILSQLAQVCEENFVDLFTDTYYDKFYIMARKPPFDKDSVMHYVFGGDKIQVVTEADILSDSLEYDSTAFTWYKLNPRYLSSSFEANFSWVFPAKYFPEYADIWGDKPKEVDNPYLEFEMKKINTEKDKSLGNKMMEAALKDFRFIISTNMYLPFTRRGTITINGDRTYKRGTFIHSESSKEIFYIDSVSHSMVFSESTDWTTTLSVSRGMFMDDVEKYFQVIDMPINPSSNSNDPYKYVTDTLREWNVNSDIFDYFIKRNQYKKLQ